MPRPRCSRPGSPKQKRPARCAPCSPARTKAFTHASHWRWCPRTFCLIATGRCSNATRPRSCSETCTSSWHRILLAGRLPSPWTKTRYLAPSRNAARIVFDLLDCGLHRGSAMRVPHGMKHLRLSIYDSISAAIREFLGSDAGKQLATCARAKILNMRNDLLRSAQARLA